MLKSLLSVFDSTENAVRVKVMLHETIRNGDF